MNRRSSNPNLRPYRVPEPELAAPVLRHAKSSSALATSRLKHTYRSLSRSPSTGSSSKFVSSDAVGAPAPLPLAQFPNEPFALPSNVGAMSAALGVMPQAHAQGRAMPFQIDAFAASQDSLISDGSFAPSTPQTRGTEPVGRPDFMQNDFVWDARGQESAWSTETTPQKNSSLNSVLSSIGLSDMVFATDQGELSMPLSLMSSPEGNDTSSYTGDPMVKAEDPLATQTAGPPSTATPSPRPDKIALTGWILTYLNKGSEYHENQISMQIPHAAQKSYHGEKRFICPPPQVVLTGVSWFKGIVTDVPYVTFTVGGMQGNTGKKQYNVCTQRRLLKFLSNTSAYCVGQGLYVSEASFEEDSNDGDGDGDGESWMEAIGDLFVRDAHEPKCEKLAVPVSIEMDCGNTIDRPRQGRPFLSGTFTYEELSVLSKPSKVKPNARNMSQVLMNGSKVSLFTRLRSQNDATKFLILKSESLNDELGASESMWHEFTIYGVNLQEYHTQISAHGALQSVESVVLSRSSTVLYFNMCCVLAHASGFVTPPVVLRGLDSNKEASVMQYAHPSVPEPPWLRMSLLQGEQLGQPVMLMQKLCLQMLPLDLAQVQMDRRFLTVKGNDVLAMPRVAVEKKQTVPPAAVIGPAVAAYKRPMLGHGEHVFVDTYGLDPRMIWTIVNVRTETQRIMVPATIENIAPLSGGIPCIQSVSRVSGEHPLVQNFRKVSAFLKVTNEVPRDVTSQFLVLHGCSFSAEYSLFADDIYLSSLCLSTRVLVAEYNLLHGKRDLYFIRNDGVIFPTSFST